MLLLWSWLIDIKGNISTTSRTLERLLGAIGVSRFLNQCYCPISSAEYRHPTVGTIEQLGPNLISDWQKGDRVAGVAHGCNAFNLEEGVFAEYAAVKEGSLFKVPENITDEEAATVGVAFATVGLGLYQTLSLPWPGSVPAECSILIYGGSSATGSIGIQFAKL